MGIQVFKVRQADQLADIGIIPDIALFVGTFIPLWFCCFTKESHIQQIRPQRIDKIDLLLGQLRRNQFFLNRIRMNAVIYFCKAVFNIPAELPFPFFFEPLEPFEQIKLKFNGYP